MSTICVCALKVRGSCDQACLITPEAVRDEAPLSEDALRAIVREVRQARAG